MKPMTAPSFRLSPSKREKVNAWRFGIDAALLLLLRFISPVLHGNSFMFLVISIYSIMAWITVLTLRPTLLPEATTTQLNQRSAGKVAIAGIPIWIGLIAGTAWLFGITVLPMGINIPLLLGFLLPTFTDEILFRNLLQSELRKLGLSRTMAIPIQSLCYALTFALAGGSVGIFLMAFLLGIFNGTLSSRYRVFWIGFSFSLIWHVVFFG